MSQFKGHMLGGVCAYVIAYSILSLLANGWLIPSFTGFVASFAGALFPDIDIYSKGQRLFFKILFGLLFVCIFLKTLIALIALLALGCCAFLVPHRSLFHDLFFLLLLTIAGMLFFIFVMPSACKTILTIAWYFIFGFVSHLILDKGVKKTFYW